MPDLNGIDLKDLDSSFGGFTAGDATPNKSASDKAKLLQGINLDDLDSSFGSSNDRPRIVIQTPSNDKSPDVSSVIANPSIASGVLQGLKDIPNSGAQLIGYIDSKLSDAGKQRNEDLNKRIKAENEQFDAANPPSDTLIPTAAGAGRVVGQALATAPLMPVKAFQAINAAGKLIPYAGKPLSMLTTGALGGGIFGGATNSTNDEGLASNVGTNAAYGAAAGPVAELGARTAGKALMTAKDIISSARTNYALRNSGIDPNAARNVLARLTDAGYTPQQAHAELLRMGPQSTLGDLTEGLATEASGLAAKGGKPTEILKGRYAERAAGANNTAHDIMETKLGVKPDFEVEKEAAKADRTAQTASDYRTAHNSKMALDVRPVVKHIYDKLENAVGPEASYLKDVGSYLFNNKGDLKVDTKPLHTVRKALDDLLEKLPKEGTSQTSHTYRSLTEVRDELDKVLKTNSDMAVADAKFAKLAEDANGLNIGRQAIEAKGSFEKFKREWDAASPEKQEFMRKGLRIQLGDKMQKASRGELSEAQRLFGKSTDNRNIVKLAFGKDGEQVLDALATEARFRGVENQTMRNAETASRHAVQARTEYGGSPHEGHFLTPIAQGAALDLVTGTPGGATAIGAGKGIVEGVKEYINREKVKNTIEGTADLLSRQSQHGRTTALNYLDSVGKIRSPNNRKLPVDYSGATRLVPLTIPPVKKVYRKLNGISEQ